ncbi:hypothetical protein [Nonomuraea sp. KM90]|uniref:hypothetical protein n=1 Tax=Nonomuraea sp. KM90 TaxID=3457428 RepID=UPI003FCE370C
MAFSYTDPDAWRIAMNVTEATLTMDTPRKLRLLDKVPEVIGSFFLRPSGGLAGFSLRLPLSSRRAVPPVLVWESANLELGEPATLRLGEQEVSSAVSVVCAEIPGEHPYVKIVLETEFPSKALLLPSTWWRRPGTVRLRLFSELHSAEKATGTPGS